MDLQLTLWSTKPGIKNLFFLSPRPWNVKEMAEEQLQTITKHFQWSCEMPWIQSIPSEAQIAPLWRSAPPLAKSIFCPSSAGFPHQTLWRLCLLTPWNKSPSLFFISNSLSLPCLHSVFQNAFLMIPLVSAHHNCRHWLLERHNPPCTRRRKFSFRPVQHEWANHERLPAWTFLLLHWGFLSFSQLEKRLFWRNLTP